MTVKTTGLPLTGAPARHATGSITAPDGTRLGYYRLGRGPGVLLVQGTMGTAEHFRQLAKALADTFTVYVPDRRGRGLSDAGGGDYGTHKEVEDLGALLKQTGARNVFGLSSGAIITLQAALSLPGLDKVCVYEPPLFAPGALTAAVARFEQEMAQGRVAAALVTAMQAAQMGPPIFNVLPRWLLEQLTRLAMKQEAKKPQGGYPPMEALAQTLHNDLKVVVEMSGPLERFSAIGQEVLLLGGSQSPAYLKAGLDGLEKVLPRTKRVVLAGLGHAAPWNADRGGQPARVAAALGKFFAKGG